MHKCVLLEKLIVQLDGRPVLSYPGVSMAFSATGGSWFSRKKARKPSICALGKILQHDHLIVEIASQIKLG